MYVEGRLCCQASLPDVRDAIKTLAQIDSGEQSVTGMAKLLDVHRVTLHKALKRQGR